MKKITKKTKLLIAVAIVAVFILQVMDRSYK